MWRQMDRRGAIAQTLQRIGGARLFGLGDAAGARESLTEALGVARAIKEPESEAEILNLLGEADLAADAPQDALARFDASLAIAVTAGIPGIEYRARAGRGRALRAAGRGEEALAELRSSAKIINDLRANIGGDLGKIGFVDIRQDVFGELVDALTEAGRTEEALEVSEASRARAFADLLAQREVLPAPSDRARLERLREASAGLKSLPASNASSPATSGADGAVERRAREFESSLSSLAEQNEELASLVTVRSATGAQIREVAARLRATIVEYMVTEKRLFVWVVSPAGATRGVAVAVKRAELAAMTKEVREKVEAAGEAAPETRARLSVLLRRLDGYLVQPVARWLPSSAEDLVVIVPNGPLSLLGFAALEDRRGRPLALRHTLVLSPAASVFRYTTEKRRARAAGTRPSALLVADPKLAPGIGLARLPAARSEVARVKRRLGGADEITVLTGASATEAAVKRIAPSREILHFATHGLISEDRPLASSLSFSAGEGEDGFLRVGEVFGMDLHADLVMLSGCSTGLGRLSGDGVLGLTRAFLYAGTPSVVVSLWDVSDRATSDLMDRFYAGLAAGKDKAHALRSAQLSTRARYPDPAFWASFILVGEP
jgi:CHAT domain-containing protein